jgi:signal transduction histidine kinase/DNA-binding response OmpR family regulator
VIYLLDEEKQVLVQKAAYGGKNPTEFTILEPLQIPIGQGIVGQVARTAVAEIIADTSQDPRYLQDDEMRYAELAVPIMLHEKVIGVIDTEHPEKDFYQEHHLEALKTIAAIGSSKIAQALADEEARKARLLQLEADNIRKLDQLKSQFFANISHEFRTPLHLILAPLRKKEEDISLDEMGMMERNAHRLLRLVNQLLDLAKVEVGILQLELQKGNIIQLLQQIVYSFVPLAQNKQITYQVDIPDRDLIVSFDPDKLEKIVYNLLSNAIKFTPSGGKVTFHAAIESTSRLRLVVSDTGLGVPEHLQDKIFDRFYQVDGTQTRAFEGTGIGLALTKELVELCRGTISLNSLDGRGSSFEVVLPLDYVNSAASPALQLSHYPLSLPDAPAHFPEVVVQTQPDAPNHRPSLLLVEDHEELKAYLKQQLAGTYTISLASNGEEGFRVAKETLPDLIISDIMMPGADGLSFTKKLKEDPLTSHIPVILLTAKDDLQSRKAGFELGAEQYLVKPFEISELQARISSLLSQRSRLQKKYSREVLLQPTATTIPDREAEFLEQAMAIVEAHIMDEDFTVESFQQHIGMSRMQLHRKIKALTDQSAGEFIRSIRLKKAAGLLQQSGMQVAEAAYLSGFNHLSYFAKCFKETFGVSPSAYQEAHAQKA